MHTHMHRHTHAHTQTHTCTHTDTHTHTHMHTHTRAHAHLVNMFYRTHADYSKINLNLISFYFICKKISNILLLSVSILKKL